MAKAKKKKCACKKGRFKSGKKKGRCKPCGPKKKPTCKCTTLPGCVAYIKKAYKFKKRAAAGKKSRAVTREAWEHERAHMDGY